MAKLEDLKMKVEVKLYDEKDLKRLDAIKKKLDQILQILGTTYGPSPIVACIEANELKERLLDQDNQAIRQSFAQSEKWLKGTREYIDSQQIH